VRFEGYKNKGEGKMKVCEIFSSIQGEGVTCGRPAVFLRLAGCNLNCKWCDTKYHIHGKDLTSSQVISSIKKFNISHLVVTGGEPLLQQRELINLAHNLSDFIIEIETNSTIMPDTLLRDYVNYWNVSPKLSNSGDSPDYLYTHWEIVNFFKENKNSIFKFVVEKEKDLEEIIQFEKVFNIPKEKIFLMPQARTKYELSKNIPKVAKWALENKFNLSNRMQVQIWGTKRGV